MKCSNSIGQNMNIDVKLPPETIYNKNVYIRDIFKNIENNS